ncbi:toll/interleukin-1 receptor domain-containing protein [Corynebacterium terpenotabidum]|nr:toll/interleukin-1 receptor domain-containing protein [Corynebacterium terpenotabidum]
MTDPQAKVLAPDGADLFISYAWTSTQHQQWVHLLAAHLKMLGYHILVDADVDYGDSLTGFMRKIRHARHVLMIVDENYTVRANNAPDSGVATENRWIAESCPKKSEAWLTVLFKDNPRHRLPDWLAGTNPKGLYFNAYPDVGDFPGSEQLQELWRWLEGLPANDDHATTIATLRERSARLERHALQSSTTRWRDPSLSGKEHFEYSEAPRGEFTFGFGEQEFTLHVSECGDDSIYLYKDPIEAVGVLRPEAAPEDDLAAHLSSGRTVEPRTGETAVLMNKYGALCLVEFLSVRRSSSSPYVAPSIDFQWQVVAGT